MSIGTSEPGQMSVSTSEPAHVRVTTGDVGLPVEVRDPRMRLLDQGLSGWSPDDRLHGRDIRLDPGLYIVSVRLPGGRTLAEAVRLEAGDDQSIDLRPGHELLLPQVRYPNAAVPASRTSRAKEAANPARWAVRFFLMEGLSQAWPIPPDYLNFSLGSDSAIGSQTFAFETVQPGVIFAQLAHPTEVPLNVALLVGRDAGCLLTVEEQADTLYAGVLPRGELVERAAQFLAAGEVEHAALVLTGREAELLLGGKLADPIGAAIGGYALLRLDELERTHDWTDNLAAWFEWLPDGAVIAGEKAAMLGDHSTALDYFLQVQARGLPLFTDGFSILVSRLRQYAANPQIRAALTDEQTADMRALSLSLERWSSLVDFSALTLTFRGAVLTRPAETQDAANVNEGFIPWPSS
jgi:hypothetical protein